MGRRAPASEDDADVVRLLLQRLDRAVDIDPHAARAALEVFGLKRGDVRAALQALNRLAPPPAQVLTVHGWCRCGHEHDTVTATGQPTRECQWVFCTCTGFRPRSLAEPTEQEQEMLRAELRRVLAARDAARSQTRRGR